MESKSIQVRFAIFSDRVKLIAQWILRQLPIPSRIPGALACCQKRGSLPGHLSGSLTGGGGGGGGGAENLVLDIGHSAQVSFSLTSLIHVLPFF